MNAIIDDIKKLVGLRLQSVRPGSDITIIEVNDERKCILLKNKNSVVQSRPYSEIDIIWKELNNSVAVHVEGVLHGSGSSRNQPETIFANLPYIEYLKINNKKHLSFVKENTHPFGTIKKMDDIRANELRMIIKDQKTSKNNQLVIVSSDISKTIDELEVVGGYSISSEEQGVYIAHNDISTITIIVKERTSLKNGTYTVIPSKLSHKYDNKLGDKKCFVYYGDAMSYISFEPIK